ncbi:L-threonylcarbamoyladenylate synthase [Nitrosovibrio sp. Nv17]|uniref:L-threonylcarbamoyladenylate synthase n=1 Tax=Nitrosovibrio sp. Nv17 TaxID=1855339 RepID=UPI000908A067|nr:L-threonylcarbamoyladenylate synthase [Nitrosovibrio sp. Nv17]SFW19368.1 translation factor SUA5 [Nitrosovibrio sp. Nv17]
MTPSVDSGSLAAAVARLKAGGVVAFPTETVYGLGAEISRAAAIRRVFEIKGRPTDHPLIVHVADASRLARWAREVPEPARRLAQHFWPGPLTLILPRSRHVPDSVTGGQDTVGLRVPSHPVALALLAALGPGGALVAPSANRFGRLSPTTAAHVHDELGNAVDQVLDGGACRIGLESTIVGFSEDTAVVLRPGGVPVTALEQALDGRVAIAENPHRMTRVPGTLATHYAPATPLECLPAASLRRRVVELARQGLRVAVLTWSDQGIDLAGEKNILRQPMPDDAAAYGSRLYATLHRLDREGFDCLLAEIPPADPAWLAVADRLQRASWTPHGTGETPSFQADEEHAHDIP